MDLPNEKLQNYGSNFKFINSYGEDDIGIHPLPATVSASPKDMPQ